MDDERCYDPEEIDAQQEHDAHHRELRALRAEIDRLRALSAKLVVVVKDYCHEHDVDSTNPPCGCAYCRNASVALDSVVIAQASGAIGRIPYPEESQEPAS